MGQDNDILLKRLHEDNRQLQQQMQTTIERTIRIEEQLKQGEAVQKLILERLEAVTEQMLAIQDGLARQNERLGLLEERQNVLATDLERKSTTKTSVLTSLIGAVIGAAGAVLSMKL